MKKFCKIVLLPCLLYITTNVATAQNQVGGTFADTPLQPQRSPQMENIVKYLLNLGLYLGYDLKKAPEDSPQSGLINPSTAPLYQTSTVYSVLGSTPVGVFQNTLINFLPSFIPYAQTLNTFANFTFAQQNFSSPSMQGTISVNPMIDQQTYQQDPVSQSVLNILATPDFSYCLKQGGTTVDQDCRLLDQSKVMNNVMGNLPNPQEFFTYNYNRTFLDQLNSNVLLAPLLYSTEVTTETTSSSPPTSGGEAGKGLTAKTQGQLAANFIRYVSGLVTPLELPSNKAYNDIYTRATTGKDKIARAQASAIISSYFNNVRSYAAQTSVGISNLYYILSKRMPQNYGTGDADPNTRTSQALSEFNMATWRIFKKQQNDEDWVAKINAASSATVQKEMAVLLAEINYQLYLNRQQNERLLLTNSILLLQKAREGQPVPQFDTGATTAQ